MFETMSELQAKQHILNEVKAYCDTFHVSKKYSEGDKISYAGRVYDSDEMVNLVDASLEFWLTSGRWTVEFEKGLGEYLDIPFVSFVNSGSSANLLAFSALTSPELGDRAIVRGDEVITVACGFPTTITPIVQFGAVPVFVDVTIPQYNVDVTQLEAALSSKTKAVMLAHTLGNPFDIAFVKGFCDKYGLWLIEDNCDALGSEYEIAEQKRKTGTFGDIGTSSFYPPHHMTTGEGGAVYTSNPLLHKIIRSMRDWGRDCSCASGEDNRCGHRFDGQYGLLPKGYDHKYIYSHFGYNFKATDLQAAIGCAQLKKLPSFVQARKSNWNYLCHELESVSDCFVLPEAAPASDPSWFGFLLTARECLNTQKVTEDIEMRGVQTRRLFAGNIVYHPCFDSTRDSSDYRIVGSLSVTDKIMKSSFWIGVYPAMSKEKLSSMVHSIQKASKK